MALQTLEANVGLRSNSPFGSTENGFLRVRETLNPAICKSIDSLFKWEIKSIGGHPTDTPYRSIGWDETPIEKELHLLCLPVKHIPPPEHEPGRQSHISGLLLLPTAKNADEYRRVGTFNLQVVEPDSELLLNMVTKDKTLERVFTIV